MCRPRLSGSTRALYEREIHSFENVRALRLPISATSVGGGEILRRGLLAGARRCEGKSVRDVRQGLRRECPAWVAQADGRQAVLFAGLQRRGNEAPRSVAVP